MTLKNYYEVLGVDPAASQEEVKHAFRNLIARYHPDKVQHLGKEFQEMAAERAAELTEAYRILSDVSRRAEYDRFASPGAAATAPPPTAQPEPMEPEAPDRPAGAGVADGAEFQTPELGELFTRERAGRDEFIKRAAIGRFRLALSEMSAEYDESRLRGFDVVGMPRFKLFARRPSPRLLGRFVSRVDRAAVARAWAEAGTWALPSNEEVCVFLMGASVAPSRELAEAIADQRKIWSNAIKITVIPIDAADWNAHVPTDAPSVAKSLVARLRNGT